jgi:y4mF family transcriptional regulator
MSPKELGRFIRKARVSQGLRQDQLAAAAGVGVRFLIELEGGKPTARLGKALDVLNALGCRIEITPPGASTREGK